MAFAEYFVFDYTCFLVQLSSTGPITHPQRIHVLTEIPGESRNKTRIQKKSANLTENSEM
jgi:hypothetical protein